MRTSYFAESRVPTNGLASCMYFRKLAGLARTRLRHGERLAGAETFQISSLSLFPIPKAALDCAHFLTRPPTGTPRLAMNPREGLQSPATLSEGVGRLFFTARIERPLFHRGGSASKKNGLPTPSPHSEAARCASTGDHQPPSPPLFRKHKGPTRLPSPPLRMMMLPPSLLVSSPGGWPESVSHCARSTRGVLDRALREHRRPIRPPSPSQSLPFP